MAQKFIIRFAGLLFFILILAAIGAHFIITSEPVIVVWILAVPLILGIPIIASVILAKDDELGIPDKA